MNAAGVRNDRADSEWQRLGPVAAGGTVLGVAISPVRDVLGWAISSNPDIPLYWAASCCGVFRSENSGRTWQHYTLGLSTPVLTCLAVAPNGMLFAGAMDGSLYCSDDFGKSWRAGAVPEGLRSPVSALLASPDFRFDRTAFAATLGGRLLVTRDRGATWSDCSLETGGLPVLALAAGPDWEEQQPLFAAAGGRVYASTDSGRTWEASGLAVEGDVVTALAVSPSYGANRTLFAGTEKGEILRTGDGGRTWTRLVAPAKGGYVAALWVDPNIDRTGRVVCAVDARVYVSSDRGDSWVPSAQLPGAILALAGDGRSLLAGLHEAGVWESLDGGRSWHSVSGGLAARGLVHLGVSSGGELHAWGPTEGVWVSRNGGKRWERLPGLTEHLPLAAAALDRQVALVATQRGILRSSDGGRTWETVSDVPDVRTLLLVPEHEAAWAGTETGMLLATSDLGRSWQVQKSPVSDQAVLSLVASGGFSDDHTLLMCAAPAGERAVAGPLSLHRSTDAGRTWHTVAALQPEGRFAGMVALPGRDGGAALHVLVAAGPHLVHLRGPAREAADRTVVDPSGAHILALAVRDAPGSEGALLAATANGVFRSSDGGYTWERLAAAPPEGSLVGLAVGGHGREAMLYAMILGGVLWRRPLQDAMENSG